MSPVSGLQKLSLADEILGHLPLVDKTAVWGTLGTIRPHLSFEVEKDVQALLKAVSGKGVAYGTIIDLLTNRSNKQRQQIAEEFLDFTKQDLLKTLEAAVSGNLEGVIVGLLRPAAQYDAHEINVALKGLEGDTLIEILSTRTSQQIREILDFYKHDFHSDLEKDVASGTSDCFHDLLVALIKGNRERYPGVIDYVLIRQDTKALVGTGGSDPGSLDDSEWIRILTQRSHEHLNRVFRRYHEMTGFQIEEAMAKILQGKAQEAGLTLVSVLRNTPLYFATKLYQAVKGPVASPRTLARILISRSETDLLSIRAEFRKHYGISLYSFIRAETNGNYQAALLGLCRAEDL
ncbi:annexin A9 isoform X1 [Rhineura floridana]|uniref:annexin A9 isoform X1 n=1 Tax=Rhineura floridana TaxID=261503 RepID=UPI002AC80BE0|nr:annexin A9 isoform X1 [Rhineura floridana]